MEESSISYGICQSNFFLFQIGHCDTVTIMINFNVVVRPSSSPNANTLFKSYCGIISNLYCGKTQAHRVGVDILEVDRFL